jgi:hypothetical protein
VVLEIGCPRNAPLHGLSTPKVSDAHCCIEPLDQTVPNSFGFLADSTSFVRVFEFIPSFEQNANRLTFNLDR